MSQSIEELKAQIVDAQRTGDYLKEYDLAEDALRRFPQEEFFQYCLVLALSRCHSRQGALDRFYSFKLYQSRDQYVRALEPRILKDMAFESLEGEQSFETLDRDRFRTAATTYRKEFGRTGAHYSAINAATLHMFAGDRELAVDLAQVALEKVSEDRGPRYFPLMTQAEACILLGRLDEAGRFIDEAAKYTDRNLPARARTCRKLRLICRYLDIDPVILAPLLPETIVHYCGHIFDQYRPLDEAGERRMVEQISGVISDRHCAIAYGSLAAGSDIIFAETLLRHGGELNVWLPFSKDSFCEEMVRPYGEDWANRFHACIRQAHTVSCATESDFRGDNSLFNFCSEVAMGMTLMRANSVDAKVVQVAVWDQVELSQRSGTYTNISKWKALGHATEIIPAPLRGPGPVTRSHLDSYPENRRESHAILFADVRHYGKMSDQDILWYYNELQPVLAAVIDEYRPQIQHLDTWGDAIFLVTEKASTAAKIASDLNNAIATADQSKLSLEEPLLMRIGLHYGPVYKVYDHLTRSYTYSSNDVTKTARIEPVTPPGEIFGTEPFVAMLELEGEGWASFAYVGTISSAKNYGAFRMFHIRPRRRTQALFCTLERAAS